MLALHVVQSFKTEQPRKWRAWQCVAILCKKKRSTQVILAYTRVVQPNRLVFTAAVKMAAWGFGRWRRKRETRQRKVVAITGRSIARIAQKILGIAP